MAGVNRETGKVLAGFEHVQHSLQVIFSTQQGSRVMREWFGNPGLRLLGEPQTEATVLIWFNILYALIELFEPRYRVRSFSVDDMDGLGFTQFTISGEFRPYAHLDWQQAAAFVSVTGNTVTIKGAQ